MLHHGKRDLPLPEGVGRTRTGYRTFVWVGGRADRGGHNVSKRWGPEATIGEMVAWRTATKAAQDHAAALPVPAAEVPAPLTGFAADALAYLEAVRAMPSYTDRVRHMGYWLAILGDKPTPAITALEIRAARDRWLTVGPKRVQQKRPGEKVRWVELPIPLAANSVNQRLRALENFFTVSYPGLPNPVRDVPECDQPPPQPKGLTFAIANEILSAMPDRTSPVKGGTHEPGGLSRARFAVMIWTGFPAVTLTRLQPDMIDWLAGTIVVPRRDKGRTSRRARRRNSTPKPLLPEALAALKQFFALGANRKFSSSSLRQSVRRAVRVANAARAKKELPLIPPATVYDLTRHTFGTEAYRMSGNLKSVQDLLGHASLTQTERYAMAAVHEGTAEAIRQLAQHSRRVSAPPPSQSRGRRARPTRRTRPRA